MSVDKGQLFGRGIAFPPRIAEGHWLWSEGEDNVREAIQIILRTEPRERLRLAEFGGGLQGYLFEPNVASTHAALEERITQVLGRWEPRIRVQSVTVEPDPDDAQAARVTLVYRLVATGDTERIGMTLTLGT
ncbi:MAG TPA: GPW/gp25 family protein [Meiothermus sp.]|jgi:phage baseplate assembly protein W|nr:GPW/gp25 family protein [Meiothermus sp.]